MRTERKRSLIDKIISAIRATRYAVTEPILLRVARMFNSNKYKNEEAEPLVSIVMPTYNRAKLLKERTLPSILNQTYKNFEILLVGDCTPDNTAEVVAEFNDPRIKFYNLPKRPNYPKDTKSRWFVAGAPARNYGLKMSKGSWIAELDDDDIFTPNHIEVLLKFAREGNYEFVAANSETERYGKRILIDEKDSNPRIGSSCTWLYRSYLKLFKYDNQAWRKKINRPHDYDKIFRMHKNGVRRGHLEKVVAYILPLPGMPTIGIDALEIITGEKLR